MINQLLKRLVFTSLIYLTELKFDSTNVLISHAKDTSVTDHDLGYLAHSYLDLDLIHDWNLIHLILIYRNNETLGKKIRETYTSYFYKNESKLIYSSNGNYFLHDNDVEILY